MNDNKFDFLIVGTGYSESILSSALSSAGYKCLHIDKNDYYGDNWATLPITELDSSTIKINNLKNPNKFLISRHPSVILTERGKPNQLDTILKSSVFNYLSFKLVDSLIHYNDGEFTQIPKSKQEVFKSTISLKDKRMLMKLLQWIASREFLKEGMLVLQESNTT
ncbi:FAD/NAD(P)-binding domain-containing protein [Wallemia mellicola]|uniref:FAD/NAD(P)-binding domain-containing protein n=1 Tax=Wallemia mellicola TaxID=1708541 RepID=A0A4T0LQL9_9BASI|nr:hypothetical protein E3Q23_03492 [Wallemia mellicola]TIB95568.1 FAD/NAD(P)-binding domain-containing protein [Wallemia mellicola]TIC21261.1 FAD/NAD(P)-binding domain-containing protein [Wallemia mellicola]TIC32851.1 FAD/NAD(P)-binding domain-containing protein [Wallemia mellicola]TIC52476.1 FAD/NAD(P)-binding domain-containing protein [Wallemia mellicola]